MPTGFETCTGYIPEADGFCVAWSSLDKCFSVYLDDIILFSQTIAEHLEHLREVFNDLRQAGLKLKPSKCTFVRPDVRFLGHVVSAE